MNKIWMVVLAVLLYIILFPKYEFVAIDGGAGAVYRCNRITGTMDIAYMKGFDRYIKWINQ